MKLNKNTWYIFHIKDFEVPTGGIIHRDSVKRKYLGNKFIGATGLPKEKFYLVQREDGKEHLLSPGTIASFEEV